MVKTSKKQTLCLYLVNYRGSTGFGQDSILSLIGQIGSQDVKDVQVLADRVLDRVRLATNPESKEKKREIFENQLRWLGGIKGSRRRSRFFELSVQLKMVWPQCLYPEGRAECATDGHHPRPQALSRDRRFSRGLPSLSPGWSVPRVLQSVCGQEPRH